MYAKIPRVLKEHGWRLQLEGGSLSVPGVLQAFRLLIRGAGGFAGVWGFKLLRCRLWGWGSFCSVASGLQLLADLRANPSHQGKSQAALSSIPKKPWGLYAP